VGAQKQKKRQLVQLSPIVGESGVILNGGYSEQLRFECVSQYNLNFFYTMLITMRYMCLKNGLVKNI
jgi:hypothetical protein